MPLTPDPVPSPRPNTTSYLASTTAIFGLLTWSLTPFAAQAETLGYWRFEPQAFLADSGPHGSKLTTPGSKGAPIEYVSRSTGPGSAFPGKIAGKSNRGMASGHHDFDYTFLERHFSADISAAASKLISHLSIEAFVHLARSSPHSMIIAGQGVQASDGAAWGLTVTSEKNETIGPLRLIFQFNKAGKEWGTNLTLVASDLSLEIGKDFYVAVTADFTDTSPEGITFYVKNLTDNTPLRTAGLAHSRHFTRIAAPTAPVTIGGDFQGKLPWFGVIDEVRLSDTKLSPAQLLINQQ